MGRAPRRLLLALTAVLVVAPVALTLVAGVATRLPGAPAWGAAAILHPLRRPVTQAPRGPFETVVFESGDVRFEGWLLKTRGERRGLVVYLHGIADNRQSGLGAARRLTRQGYDFFAFDARAHGRSGGEACSYGYAERHDVSHALDALGAQRAILLGHSLGAAVALQAAAVDQRVAAVVAAATFSDLPTIVRERARWFWLPGDYVEAALRRAGELGHFVPEQASPLALAREVRVPVLLLHGATDWKTPPAHSRRLAAALGGPQRLVVLPGVGHDEILGREQAWREIEPFLQSLGRGPGARGGDAHGGIRRQAEGGRSGG
jgi:pimeloyl-ACP methyl ester carboxylesterase